MLGEPGQARTEAGERVGDLLAGPPGIGARLQVVTVAEEPAARAVEVVGHPRERGGVNVESVRHAPRLGKRSNLDNTEDPDVAPAEDWTRLRARLAAALTALGEHDVVVAGEPAPEPRPPRGLLRRRARPEPHRYVQFLGLGDGTIRAECVGATLFGGDLEIAPEVHERLRALGWAAPGDLPVDDVFGWGYPNYRAEGTTVEADRLADLGTEALTLLGLSPDAVDLQRPG